MSPYNIMVDSDTIDSNTVNSNKNHTPKYTMNPYNTMDSNKNHTPKYTMNPYNTIDSDKNNTHKYEPEDALILYHIKGNEYIGREELGRAIAEIKTDEGKIVHQLTRTYMKKNYDVGDGYWLTEIPGENNVPPQRLGIIQNYIISIAEDHKPVLIEGLEVLIGAAPNFESVKSNIRTLRDYISELNGKLIVVLRPNTLGELEQNQLNMLATSAYPKTPDVSYHSY